MARLHLLRVFCGEGGTGGNPLAVFLEGGEVPSEQRQPVAADLGLSETVFVDDPQRGEIHIFTPTVELPFAGHPTVGSAWLLAKERAPVESLLVPAGELAVRYDGELTNVSTRPEWAPAYEWRQLGSPGEVEALSGPPDGSDMFGAWAWIDEQAGSVRTRVFPVGIGIAEDEATGAASVGLCAQLGRELQIHQGRGSLILARPRGEQIELGGRSALDEVRSYALQGG
ncbi:MAG TPA: PhzF family phenazine biosynthesis protein [Thermoleophilaceae bacterium]|nr:PhzF family phenazine biosynthesis protein [Thermoleophilaceae bacterium]